MIKEQVVVLIQAKKDEVMASVGASFDALMEAVNALEEPEPSVIIAQLQAQVQALEIDVQSKQGLLAQADQLAKAIDAAIPDA